MQVFVRCISALSMALALAGAATVADAKGIARVQESDGTVRMYDVSLEVIDHRAVHIISADKKGTLIIGKAACSYAGEIERCLPYRIELDQFGRRHEIAFERGTEYLNRTATAQQLPMSSDHVPPHGILLVLLTARGTYITVRGTIDGFHA